CRDRLSHRVTSAELGVEGTGPLRGPPITQSSPGHICRTRAGHPSRALTAVLLDLFSRRVVGWALDDHMRAELPLRALSRALRTPSPEPGLIAHSDRGSQYAAPDYRKLPATWGLAPGPSDAGHRQ